MIKGYVYSLIASMLWSANFIIAKIVNNDISPIELAFYRWSIALCLLLPLAPSLLKNIHKITANKTDLLVLIIASLMGVSIFNTLIYLASAHTSAINLALIATTSPIFITLINKFYLKINIKFITWIGVIIATIGCVFLITKGSITTLLNLDASLGDLFMLLAAIAFAIYTIAQKRSHSLKSSEYLLALIFVGLLIMLPFYLTKVYISGFSVLNMSNIPYILYLGICASLIAFYLWNKSIKSIGTTKTGVVYYTIPIFVYLMDSMLHGNTLNYLIIISFILIIAGVLIIHFTNNVKQSKNSS